MIESKIDYKKVFQLFVETRPGFTVIYKPFRMKGTYFATDKYSLIALPVEKADLPFEYQNKPKYENIFPKKYNCNVEISVADINRQLIPDMMDELHDDVTSKVECYKCGGEGETICNLGHWYECPLCKGEGSLIIETKRPTGKRIPNTDKVFTLLGVSFQYFQLRRLVDACNLMGVKKIIKVFKSKKKGNLFQCGDAEILIMPAIITGYDRSEFKVTDIIL